MLQTNVYNVLDTQVGSTTNRVANAYLRNGAYVTAPVIKDSNATFTPGVSERRGSTTTFSHSGLKNADAQTGVSQAVNATQKYDAFGNLASSTGTWQGQFGYGGGFGYQQDATGLKLLGHRYYDASTGRFLTRDPIKDGRNWYGYAGIDPIGFADPDGKSAVPVVAAVELTLVEGGLSAGGAGAGAGVGAGVGAGATAGLAGAAAGIGWAIGRLLDEHLHISDQIIDHYYLTELPGGVRFDSEHRKNKRKSTKGPHQEGQARKAKEKAAAADRRRKEKNRKRANGGGPGSRPGDNVKGPGKGGGFKKPIIVWVPLHQADE